VYVTEHPELATALRELLDLRERIARAALAGPGATDPVAYAQALAEWTASREELEIALAREIPELALAERLKRADVAAVQAALPGGSVLVDFVQLSGESLGAVTAPVGRLLAFVLPATSGALAMFDLGGSAEIDRLVATARTALTGRGDSGADVRAVVLDDDEDADDARDASGAADRLRATIFDPLEPAIGGARRLFIAPDGALHRFPFEVLPLARGGALIDAYTVSYLGAGRDTLRLGAPRSTQATAPIVLADPDYDLTLSGEAAGGGADAVAIPQGKPGRTRELQRSGLSFAPLPGTREEGAIVAELLHATTYAGAAAIERALKQCRSPRILHIATHGFYLHDEPTAATTGDGAGHRRLQGRLENPMLRSGLALAGANTWLANGLLPEGAEDALLNGEDVSGLDLMATELVVLSACESGLGAVQAGEGVYGLRRAFVLAGAATLVVSLWPVPDQQTQELMADFYRRMLAGVPRADALRAAQLALKERHPHPRDWGAFICVGEPGALGATVLPG
jgi:CHAT domain-containing protein